MRLLGYLAIIGALLGVTWAWLAAPGPRDRYWLTMCCLMTAVCTLIAYGGGLCLRAGN